MTYYLYIKVHIDTNLRYLGYTSQDPYTYKGSGIDWERHLRIFGNNTSTEILAESESLEEISNLGRFYSKLWRITTSVDNYGNRIWANRIPECATGYGRPPGFKHTDETRKKISAANRGYSPSEDTRKRISVANTGKEHTDDTKEKISKYRTGKIHTEETKLKISEKIKIIRTGVKRGPYKKK